MGKQGRLLFRETNIFKCLSSVRQMLKIRYIKSEESYECEIYSKDSFLFLKWSDKGIKVKIDSLVNKDKAQCTFSVKYKLN